MIIQSIRLKNVKSYGTGPEETGITIHLQPGVNRIAGRNGHGKSTLIEAIGYALFLTKPDYEETFSTHTYLLRNGTKEGEIDVTFKYRGQRFRIERGVGQKSKRRSKVIDLIDDSICAEGDAEVSDFLRRLLELPSAENLGEIFSKLIGVKQGRLTWPFDSKPSQAKKYFEPLFDVAVFRECFDKLKPARDQLDGSLQDAREKNAGIVQKIEDRADSREQLEQASEHVVKTENEEKAALELVEIEGRKKAQLEQREKDLAAITREYESACNNLKRANDQLTVKQEQLKESEKALKEVAENKSAYDAFRAAEEKLKKLEEQREQRDALQASRDKATGERRNLLTRADAAEAQYKSFQEQLTSKTTEQKKFQDHRSQLEEQLSQSRADYENSSQQIREATEKHALASGWISSLVATGKRLSKAAAEIINLEKAISSWNPVTLETARLDTEKAESALHRATGELNKATERERTLKAQLGQISGGVCPFLKERCRQFDPDKVQGDLTSAEISVQKLSQVVLESQAALKHAKHAYEPLKKTETRITDKSEALKSLRQHYETELSELHPPSIIRAIETLAKWDQRIKQLPTAVEVTTEEITTGDIGRIQNLVEDFLDAANNWWKTTNTRYGERAEAYEKTKSHRTRDLETLSQLKSRISENMNEISKLQEQAAARKTEREQSYKLAKEYAKQIAEWEERLKPFKSLTEHIKSQQKQKDDNRQGYEDSLKAKKVADELPTRTEILNQTKRKREDAAVLLKEKERTLKAAQTTFDPKMLVAAREAYHKKRETLASIQTNLTHARKEAAIQKIRYHDWLTARKEHHRIKNEMERLQAAIDITELARRLLQKAAPAVAQHLCDRIANRAQILYNQINPDPIELSWDANRYSVKIVPGNRRFAMLSGGEQTKLALALTLSMIEEFGGLSFCIFDEPTYGVDSDSRQKLADAIIEAQSAAGLEQLLLVSHDDVFEGKIEHSILLRKDANSGSELALSN